MRKHWTAIEEEQLKKAVEFGMMGHEIATLMNRSKESVYCKSKRMGLDLQRLHDKKDIAMARELFEEHNIPVREIAEKFEISVWTVRSWLQYRCRGEI